MSTIEANTTIKGRQQIFDGQVTYENKNGIHSFQIGYVTIERDSYESALNITREYLKQLAARLPDNEPI
jgi:hypothetical protein